MVENPIKKEIEFVENIVKTEYSNLIKLNEDDLIAKVRWDMMHNSLYLHTDVLRTLILGLLRKHREEKIKAIEEL